MLQRSALQREIDLLSEELRDFESGRVRVSRKTDGHMQWEDATHHMMLRTRIRIDTLQDAMESVPSGRY